MHAHIHAHKHAHYARTLAHAQKEVGERKSRHQLVSDEIGQPAYNNEALAIPAIWGSLAPVTSNFSVSQVRIKYFGQKLHIMM